MKGIILILLCFCRFLLSAQTAEISIQKDIVYGHAGGVDLKLDMAKPEGAGPFPVIVFFHGGGWQAGNKSDGHHWIRTMVSHGFAGVSVGYRFAPAFRWPAQILDAKAAIRFLRANAASLNIDPERIGVMGESAGGYLALMVGTTGPRDGLEGDGGNPGVSSHVQAVVTYFASADFTLPRAPLSPEAAEVVMKYYGKTLPEVIQDFTGAKDSNDPILKKISVLPYIDKSDPPVLIFQGDADPFVSVRQATRLDSALQRSSVPHQLVIVKGGGHGWAGEMAEQTTMQMLTFLGNTKIAKSAKR